MGIGTIVGSAIFNALGVAAIGSLAAITVCINIIHFLGIMRQVRAMCDFFCLYFQPIKIESRPVTRDVVIYMINVGVLVAFVWDGQIDWYEALVLGILYILYFIVMFNSMRMFALYDKCVAKYFKKNTSLDSEYILYTIVLFIYFLQILFTRIEVVIKIFLLQLQK